VAGNRAVVVRSLAVVAGNRAAVVDSRAAVAGNRAVVVCSLAAGADNRAVVVRSLAAGAENRVAQPAQDQEAQVVATEYRHLHIRCSLRTRDKTVFDPGNEFHIVYKS